MDDAPFIVITGLNTTPANLEPEVAMRFNDAWSQIHVPDVTESNPGFIRGTRYVRVTDYDPDHAAPRWIVVYDVAAMEAMEAYIERDKGPREAYPALRQWTDVNRFPFVWRTIWRRLTPGPGQIGAAAAPYLYFVGQRPRPGTVDIDAEGLQRYYDSNQRLSLAENGCTRASRYELYHELKHPAPGAPALLAAYEGEERLFDHLTDPNAAVEAACLPAAWSGGWDTVWNVVYRRVSSYVRAALVMGDHSLGKPPR